MSQEMYSCYGMIDILAELLSSDSRAIIMECKYLDDIYTNLPDSFELLSRLSRQKEVPKHEAVFLSSCVSVYERLAIHLVRVIYVMDNLY